MEEKVRRFVVCVCLLRPTCVMRDPEPNAQNWNVTVNLPDASTVAYITVYGTKGSKGSITGLIRSPFFFFSLRVLFVLV